MKVIGFLPICLVLFVFGFYNPTSSKQSNQEMNKDSIKVLLHKEYMQDSIKVQRTVFLDYKRHSEYKRDYYKADSLYLKYWINNVLKPNKPENENLIVNLDKNLLNTYVSISKLNGSYIFFSQDEEDIAYTFAYVKDSTITFLHMDGWYVYYYKKLEQSNHKIFIDTNYNPVVGDKLQIGIKTIDKVHDIQIWKVTRTDEEGKVSTDYELKAPLNYALKLPILIIDFSEGIDPDYNGIDKLDLKKMYNE
jgi:hypothetical protein